MVIEYIRYRVRVAGQREFEDSRVDACRRLRTLRTPWPPKFPHGIEDPESYVAAIEWEPVERRRWGLPERGAGLFFGGIKPRHYELAGQEQR